MKGNFQGRGVASMYAAGRAHIRKLNAEEAARTAAAADGGRLQGRGRGQTQSGQIIRPVPTVSASLGDAGQTVGNHRENASPNILPKASDASPLK